MQLLYASALAVVVYALQMVKGFGWTWNTGGYEYPVFWGITCLAVAIWEFRRVYGDSTFKARATIGGQPHRSRSCS